MKKLQPEVLENRALLSGVSCTVETTLSAACTLNGEFTPTGSHSFQLTTAADTGSMVLSSSPDDLGHFKFTLTDGVLTIRSGVALSSSVIGTCTLVAGASGIHGAPVNMEVCNFGSSAGVSGTQTHMAPGFRAHVGFPLLTTLNAAGTEVALITQLTAGSMKGEVKMSGPAVFEFRADSDSTSPSGQSTIALKSWIPVVTSEGAGEFTFSAANQIVSVGSLGSATTAVTNPNFNADLYNDPATGPSPRQTFVDEFDKLFPI